MNIELRRARKRRHYAKHRERLLARSLAYYAANKIRRREYQQEWRRKNAHAIKLYRELGVGIPKARQMIGANQ